MKAVFGKAFKAVRKYFVPGMLGLVVMATIAHYAWKASGSNEWKLIKDENGIQIYSLKAPGSTLLKFRAKTRVKTSLASSVFLFRGDESTNDDFGGKNFKVFDRVETPSVYLAYFSVEQPMPPPFGTKELVCLLNYAQDPKTKEVLINVQAAPSKKPPTPNTTRVTHLNNMFRLTPLPNGEVEWEVTGDVDMGLFYPLANVAMPEFLFKGISDQRQLVLKEKYQKAKLVSVQEMM
ncbi:MAG TPA: hypothetical protein VEC06_13380 [Paucimonas sp.]|nr:hypothetical protein [Paucimonas sp.]